MTSNSTYAITFNIGFREIIANVYFQMTGDFFPNGHWVSCDLIQSLRPDALYVTLETYDSKKYSCWDLNSTKTVAPPHSAERKG